MTVSTIYKSNFRNVPETLRVIAKEIEDGMHAEVDLCGIVLLGSAGIEVFGAGEDSDAAKVALLFHGGFEELKNILAQRPL